jgi:serine/threonine-protein kinase
MGVVIGATHLHLQQPVALKFLSPEMLHSPQIVERFVREARASAQLRGEHVCRVSDVGAFDNGAPYIVMELLEGCDLASLLQTGGPLAVQRAADYVLQACLGVAEAHAVGIVHRDLKPANLFLTRRPDGTPLIKVLDFGIAKAESDRNFSLTQTSAVLGSPGYMSPEQLRSTRDVDVRSDIWSIGVILYELVSGRPPFTGESITELALRIAMDPPPPLIGRMPQGFDLLIDRCLAKDPAQRYPDLANLAHALAVYAGPAGWETANGVSRLLNVAPQAGHDAGSGGSQPALAGAPIATQVLVTQPGPGARIPTPTTMGSAASSMITGARATRRWGLIAGVALTVIVGVVATVVVASGGHKLAEPTTQNTVGASPPARPATAATLPTTVPPDAAARVPDASPPDAALVPPPPSPPSPIGPIDAGTGELPKVPRPRKPHPKQPETHPEDFGESRF